MAIIPSNYLNAVVAIGVDTMNGGKFWIGTGFLVSRKEKDNPDFSTYYLITNKHVVEGVSRIYLRFNSLGDQFVRDYPVQMRNEHGNRLYSSHPDNLTDVIALQIIPQTLVNDKSIWGAFSLDENTYTLEEMQNSGISEGNFVFSLGFPMNLVGNISAPICRLGCISCVKEAYVLRRNTPIFLVDAQTFPGNSGGPIVCPPESIWLTGAPHSTDARLIGILSAYIPYKETLYSRQTGRDRMLQEENSGLTIVHPVDRIKEVVELEWERIEQQRKVNNEATLPASKDDKEEAVI